MSKFTAAAIQLNSQPDLSISMERTEHAIETAAKMGADWVALPENFAFLGNEKEKLRQAEKIFEKVQETIPRLAEKFGIYILAGGFPVRAENNKVFNRAMMVAPDGSIVANYDKIHLFDVTLSVEETYRESDTVESGLPEPVVCDTVFRDHKLPVKIGLSICYDLRFPELYRNLAGNGAEILCVPAAFTQPTGEAHWETLLRARAIENSCYVAAPAQTGQNGPVRKTYGHSMIIDPWGTVLSDAGTEPGMAIAEIDTDLILKVRKKLPSLTHRVLF